MRRQYAGAAQAAQLTAGLAASTAALTISCDDLTNWPDGSIGPFYVVVDRGLASEEKILCVSRSGNTLTVFDDGLTNGRAADDTSLTSHNSNAVIEHIFTATDANEANLHVNSTDSVHGVEGDVVGTTDIQTLTNKTISQGQITGLTAALAAKAALAGATFTGEVDVVSATATGSTSVRQITISTADPTGGADGDIWVKYVP